MIPISTVRYYLSDKGLQEKTSPFLLTPQELQLSQNVHFYENGAWTKRSGYAKRFTNDIAGAPIMTGMYELTKRNGTKTFVMSTSALYEGAQGDASPTAIAGGLTFTTGANGENLMSFITFNNKAIGANGIEDLWQFDGTTASVLAGSPPICPIITSYQNIVFIAGNATYPYRLYFSNDGNETVWTGTDYIDIGDLTSPITGLAILFGKLYIFTLKAIYELRGYDRDTFVVDEVTLSIGCVSHKSIVKVDNNLIFWSDRGIYSFDGINVHYLSENAQVTISELNYSRVSKIVAEVYKARNQVWFAVSTGSNSQNNAVICMTYKVSSSIMRYGISEEDVAFATYTGMAFNCFGVESSTTQLNRLYSGNYAGRVHLQDYGNNDDGAGIDFKVKLPPLDMGKPEAFKMFRYLRIFVRQKGSYNLNVSYQTDFGLGGTTTVIPLSVSGSASLWGTMVWGTDIWGGSSILKTWARLKAKGNHLEIIFSNSNADQPIVIIGLSLMAQVRSATRR
jgi:hypothetical protein